MSTGTALPIISKGKGLLNDGIDVYADRVLLHHRGRGTTILHKSQITEVKVGGRFSFIGASHAVHIKAGDKKYVRRALKKSDAQAIVDAILH